MKKDNNKTNPSPQEMLTCPVCGKEFEVNDDTKYIIAGGYTCSWKCFLDEVKRREARKKEEEKDKPSKQNKNKQ